MTRIARAARPTIFAALCCVFNVQAGELPAGLQKSLKAFSTVSVTMEDGALKINMRKPVVSRRDVYRLIVKMGACYPLWNDPKNGWGSASIARIEVKNDIGAQGFAFNGGRKECAALGKSENTDAEDRYIDAHTWVCVAGNACRPRRPGEQVAGDE
ncbi:TPA: hypothetical protein QDB03_002873 [Burkholderia vietnamiensis]|nr:hypothetical protein [Burkholderia vietnamiensis]